jgi:hypothetical protein
MAREESTLCALCRQAAEDPFVRNPSHVVHPVTGAHGLYDIRGEAVCPHCDARWRRSPDSVELVEWESTILKDEGSLH